MTFRLSYPYLNPARRPAARLAKDYPCLYELSINRGMEVLSVYTKSDMVKLFGCSEKTIRRWTSAGLLPNRRLPNRGRCLPGDLENFLRRTDTQAAEEITNE